MKDGQISAYVALEKGPDDTVESFDWTDLTDRVKRYSDDRGRTDVLQPFGPGTAQVLLDNGDRMLDPSNPTGLVYAADGKGLPLCPVKVTQWFDGTEYPKFTGYLGPEAWPGSASPYGQTGMTTLHVIDAIGHSPGLPPDQWGLGVAALHPDWWSRMDDLGFPILDDGSEVPNSIGDGHATIEGTTGISRPFNWYPGTAPAGFGIDDPGLLLSGDHALRFPASGIMPDGDQDKLTLFVWWGARTPIEAGESAMVARFVHPLTGLYRLSVYVDGDDGLAYVTTYDAAETVVDTATISPIGFSRWDGANQHMVTVRWDAGTDNNCTVWFGGVSATLAIPGDLYGSDLLLGPAPVDVLVDEVALWRRALDIEFEIELVFMTGGFGLMWNGDIWHDRLAHFIDATGRSTDADDTNQMHFPVEDVRGLWALIRPGIPAIEDYPGGVYGVTLPDTLAAAYQITVESAGGARWATKDGEIRARSLGALTDPTWAEHYADPVLFTDGDTSDPDAYRHAGVEVTGLRIDRVINLASVEFMFSSGGPPNRSSASSMSCVARDNESIARYGIRSHKTESAWCDWLLNQYLAELKVARFAQPQQEFERIHLDPTGTGPDAAALTEWLVTTCELELACSVTYTSAGADPVTVEDLNIQHISTEWTPERWSVDLVAAKS